MKPYRLVIFDFDGTLCDSFDWFLRAVNEAADRYSFRRIEEAEVETLRGKSSREIIRHLEVPAWKLPAIARFMRRLKSESFADMALFPGTMEMLQALRDGGLLLAIVSSDAEANVCRSLGDAEPLFETFSCDVSLFGKSVQFRRVMQQLNVAPQLTLCIGDEVRDAVAARKAGASFGAVTWGYATPDALKTRQAALIFETPRSIAASLL
ncbi:MAG TPA: HAD hydrolase-like protein [Xanthobacteraceae bacterium]|nr:HAD hydrolase-like protein [Xanthobacteraceae bacterium]